MFSVDSSLPTKGSFLSSDLILSAFTYVKAGAPYHDKPARFCNSLDFVNGLPKIFIVFNKSVTKELH